MRPFFGIKPVLMDSKVRCSSQPVCVYVLCATPENIGWLGTARMEGQIWIIKQSPAVSLLIPTLLPSISPTLCVPNTLLKICHTTQRLLRSRFLLIGTDCVDSWSAVSQLIPSSLSTQTHTQHFEIHNIQRVKRGIYNTATVPVCLLHQCPPVQVH